MKNIICLWGGEIVDIPAGWALCDGNNGTPDLRDRIVVDASGTYTPNQIIQTNIEAGTKEYLYALCYIMKL